MFDYVTKKVSDTTLQYMVYSLFVPSGLSKFIWPSQLMALWPTLPTWFWYACGCWELICVYLFYNGNYDICFALLMTFMGGVFSSLVVLPGGKDVTKGKTFMQAIGKVMLTPCFYGIFNAICIGAKQDRFSPYVGLACFVSGCLIGFALGDKDEKDEKDK
jgi:hypothetical protein